MSTTNRPSGPPPNPPQNQRQQQRSATMGAAAPPETHWRTVHRRRNEDLLFAEDLKGRRSVDVEVIDSGVREVKGAGNKAKPMPWLAFRGTTKRLALNVTNCKAMQSVTGTGVVQKWRGWITLTVVLTEYTDQDTGRREKTDAIRIALTRPGRPQDGAAAIATESPPADPAAVEPSGVAPATAAEPSADERRLIEQAEREASRG